MNYLRGFKSVLGSPSAENQPSAQETIERLCDRVDSSTLLEDRRDAVRALKSLSKKFRLEVGTQAVQLLIKVLQMDRSDTEIVGMAIETLCNIMSTEPQVQDEQTPTKSGSQQSDSDVGLQFTEIFIKNADNVTLLLGILEEYEFHVRWPTVKLLTMLLTNKPNLLQQCILVSPMGVSRLMDLLSDSREIIRNEGLLLLIQLTKSNAAIQKIVAFENAFDRLFEIIAEEGYSDGGIVVEDCLHLMINLLRNNVSNQNFFREGSFIQRFTPFFEMSALAMQGEDEDGWLEQKVSNVQQMLKVVRILVSPDNPQQATTGAQKMMNQSGLLKLLCDILMASGIPADILTEAINTVSEVIRGFPANQEYFSLVNAPSEPPRPAIVVLLMSMINDKQPFSLRCAVLYCFQCYLHKNEQGQSQIVSTLLPSSSDVAASVSAGQLLCAGIFSMDPLSNWCAAVALSHCIKGNPTQKEQLLRVQLATSLGNPPVSLLQQCTNILAQGGDVQTRVGLLLLLCSWLSNCPIAVAHFLHNTANIPHLMAQVVVDAHGEEGERLVGYLCALLLGLCLAYNDDSVEQFKKDDLKVLINKRIGQDNLLEKISYISKSEYFTAAVKSPQIKDDGTHQVLIDHEFTKLFKKFDAAVTKAVEETTEAQPTANHNNVENHDSIVASYKELIREQDEELCRVRSRYADMESSYNQATAQLQHQAQEIHQLKSQLAFAQSYQHSQRSDEHVSPQPGQDLELDSLRNQMNELYISKQDLEKRLQDKSEQCQKLEKDLEVANAQYAVAAAAAELAEPCDSLNSSLNKNQLEDMLGLRKTVSTLEHEVATLKEQNAALQEDLNRAKLQLPGSSIETTQRCKELEARLAEVTIEKDSQLQEHEDLLVMLADQEEKLAKYKKMLKDAGHEVSEDDDEDEDDNVDEEDDDEGVEEEEEEEAVEVKEEQEEIKEQPDLPQEEENIGEEVTPEQETEVNTNGFDEETNFDELQTQSIMEEIPVAVEEHGKSSQEESNENIATPHKETEQHAATTTDVGEELQEPIEEKGIEEDPDIHHVGEEEIEGYSQPATDAHAQFNDQSNPEQPYDPNEQQNYYDNNGQQFYTDDQQQMNYYSYGQGGDSTDFLTGYDSSGNYNGYSMQQGDDTQIGGYYGDNAQGNYNNFYDNSQPANDGQFFTQHKTQTNVEDNVNVQQSNSNSYSQQQQLYYNWDQYPGNTSTDAHVKQDAGLFGGY